VNSKVASIVNKFGYTLASNLISLLVSILVILIVPKLIGVKDYGFWQLYLFYSSYVGFLHFGWNDGIYLRYGGTRYSSLNRPLFFSQFFMLITFEVLIALLVIAFTLFYVSDPDRSFIFYMVAICLIITNVRWMIIFVLQATNRIKEYAVVIMLGRLVYVALIVTLIFFGYRVYKLMIIADLAGRFISLAYAVFTCRDFIFLKFSEFYLSFQETFNNIIAGSKLMFSNIASMLIIGVVRLGIERSWDVSIFGKVSLTLSASNLLMLFINAVGIILFPVLRRTAPENLASIYKVLRDFLMVVLLGLLIFYYPLKVFLSSWLPKYSESLMYLALLFPICLFEGKMALLINTYLKSLREERIMMLVNFLTLALSVLTTGLIIFLFKDLNMLVVSIVGLLAFRSIVAEAFLAKKLKLKVFWDNLLEIGMTIAFIMSGWFIDSWITVLAYSGFYILYIFIKQKSIINSYYLLRGFVKE